MEYTQNSHLKKPGYSDTVDIKDLNDNFDIIDEALNDAADNAKDAAKSIVKSLTVSATSVDSNQPASVENVTSGDTLSLQFKIPKGQSGADGKNGTNGAAAGFGTPTATIDANTGTPSVTVSTSGPDTAKVFNFAFKNLKGATGGQGPTGPQGENGSNASNNMLINWYFRGYGSHQAPFRHPINQRGKTTYTGLGFTIDHWELTTSASKLVTGYSYATLTGSIRQRCECTNHVVDNVSISASVLLGNGTLVTATGKQVIDGDTGLIDHTASGIRIYVMYDDEYGTVNFTISSNPSTSPVQIVAAKLEIGDTQTLAVQNGSKWVLADPPPDPILERLKCMRYYLKLSGTDGSSYGPIHGFAVYVDDDDYMVYIPTPVPMRIRPSEVLVYNTKIMLADKETTVVSTNSGDKTECGVSIRVEVYVGFSHTETGNVIPFRLGKGATLELDAEL